MIVNDAPTSYTYLQNMLPYLRDPNVQGMYGMWNSPTPGLHPDGTVTPGEGGVDLDSPQGTPVYALADGVIQGAGYWKDQNHGVITTRVYVPGYGNNDLYYQHIILDPSIHLTDSGPTGQTVQRGQLIGTIGSYGEVEMGFNAYWGGIWGAVKHPNPWVVDPRPLIKTLMLMKSSSMPEQTGTGSIPDNIDALLAFITVNTTGFNGICLKLDLVEQFQPFQVKDKSGNVIELASQIAKEGEKILTQGPASIIPDILLPADTIQAVFVFVGSNALATVVRSLIIFIGLVVCVGLVINFMTENGPDTGDIINAASSVGKIASTL